MALFDSATDRHSRVQKRMVNSDAERRHFSSPVRSGTFIQRYKKSSEKIRDFTLALDIGWTGIVVWFEYGYS